MVSRITEFMINIRRISKHYDSMLKEICGTYHLTLIEAVIISFLHNNPEKDTAADIVELRMLQKGNVSQAVETLAQKSLISRRPDGTDRRKIHLTLTPAADPILCSMEKLWRQFEKEIFRGLSGADLEIFDRVNDRIIENVRRMSEGEGKNEQ